MTIMTNAPRAKTIAESPTCYLRFNKGVLEQRISIVTMVSGCANSEKYVWRPVPDITENIEEC